MSDPYADLRREYADGGLGESDLAADPFAMFQRWYDDAVAAEIYEPNAMVVASVSADGRPSARMVLLKGFSEDGWVFFTNLGSRKGSELRANPHCHLLFPWHPVERQVRVDGVATELPRSAVDTYFATRPPRTRRTPTRCRCPTSGVASGSCPRPWSSGRAGRVASTTGSSTAVPTPAGPPTASPPDPVHCRDSP